MSKFVVITLSNEASAYKAVSALNELHNEGSITLYGTAVVRREANGTLTTERRTPAGPVGAGLGAVVGAVIGAFAGPAGAAIGLVTGSAAGGLGGIVHGEVSDEFLEDIMKEMKPGTFAVFAEVSEQWTAPIDTRIEALGGKVFREYRADVVDAMFEKRAEARRDRLAERKAAHAARKAERMETRIEQEIEDVRDKLQRTADKASRRLEATKQELEEKLRILHEQARRAEPVAKKQIDDRISELRKEFGDREKKLHSALKIAQQALQG